MVEAQNTTQRAVNVQTEEWPNARIAIPLAKPRAIRKKENFASSILPPNLWNAMGARADNAAVPAKKHVNSCCVWPNVFMLILNNRDYSYMLRKQGTKAYMLYSYRFSLSINYIL